jgi:hypothetical protein
MACGLRPVSGYWFLVARGRLLVTGFLFLVAFGLRPVAGFWRLVAGCWLLVSSFSFW